MVRYDWRGLALASSEYDLAARILSDWTSSIGAGLAGVYLWTSVNGGEVHTRGVRPALLDDYEAFGRIDDPLLARVERRHMVAVGDIAAMRARTQGYAEFAGRHCSAFQQYAVVPLVANGTMAGAICLSLTAAATAAADRQRRAALEGLALHASARLAQLRQRNGAIARWEGRLAPDDLVLCDLVSGGHTVSVMASALGVSVNTVKKRLKRLYAVLNVASRAELAMQFVFGPDRATRLPPELGRFGRWSLASQQP